MPFSIDFEHRVAGMALDKAFGIVVAWLQQQDAKIKVSSPPTHVEAVHGRAVIPMGWAKDGRKTIVFDLTPVGPDVRVRAKFTPAFGYVSDVQTRQDDARANWGELLGELWERMGERGAVGDAIRRPGVDWEASLWNGRGMIYEGAVLLVLGIVIMIALILLAPNVVYAAGAVLTTGVLLVINGAMIRRSARRRLARQRE